MEFNSSMFGIQFNVKPNMLNECFEKVREYDEDEMWESKETFVHDVDDDLKFSYKYVIRWETFWDEENNTDNSWYALYLIPTPESCCEKAVDNVTRYTDYECTIPDMIDYGYGIIMGQHSVENSNVCDEEILNLIANVYNAPIDRMRGFYLDRPVNRLGTTGWDSLKEMIEGVDSIQATIDRYNKQLGL